LQPRFLESDNKRVLYSIPLDSLLTCLLTLFSHKNIILRKLLLLNIKRHGHRGKKIDQTIVEDEIYRFWSLPTLLESCGPDMTWHATSFPLVSPFLFLSYSYVNVRHFVASFQAFLWMEDKQTAVYCTRRRSIAFGISCEVILFTPRVPRAAFDIACTSYDETDKIKSDRW